MVERKYGQARRVWVFDRGIVSDANLAAIRRRGGQYLVGTRRTALRHVERALLEGPWTQVRDEVEAQLIPIPGGTETYVLGRLQASYAASPTCTGWPCATRAASCGSAGR